MTEKKRNSSFRVIILEKNERKRPDFESCRIDDDIKFSTAGLEAYCLSNWEPIIYDTFLVAAAVDFCDQTQKRAATRWARTFDVHIPVHDPNDWSGNASVKLKTALDFLTGDRWHIEFRQRKSAVTPPAQQNFEMPVSSAAVLPFSDGLDSLMASRLIEPKTELIRIRLAARPKSAKTVNDKLPFTVIPYRINRKSKEPSARSRGFRFTLLSGVAAYLSKAKKIVMPESGQGALGPVLVPVGHNYEDYRNHPRFTDKMADLLLSLFGHKVEFVFPRLWYTKGETLREYATSVGEPDWLETQSCWQQNRHCSVNGRRRQCGICAACMLRRLSIHTAGLADKPDNYVWENLKAGTFTKGASSDFPAGKITEALREYAIAGTRHLDDLAVLHNDSSMHIGSIQRSAQQMAPILGLTPQNTEEKLKRLLKQHDSEWNNFIETLGSDSFITKWTSRR